MPSRWTFIASCFSSASLGNSIHSGSFYVGHLRHNLLPTTLQQAAVFNKPHAADNIRLSPGVYRMLIPKGQISHFGEI